MTEVKPSACMLCELICGIQVEADLESGTITKIKGDRNHPASKGYLCNKAGRLNYYQNGRDRITRPLRRKPDGSFEEIDWDTAFSEIANKLSAVKNQYGGDKILYLSGGQGSHLGPFFGQATRAALGAIYKSNPIAQEKTGEIYVGAKMFQPSSGIVRSNCETAEIAIFLGKNPWQSHGYHQCRKHLQKLAKDESHTMVVVDPRRSESAAMADIHLAVKPGTDAWMMAALIAILVQDDLVDHEFMRQHTIGYEDIAPHFADVPVDQYCKECGIEEATLRDLALRIGNAKSVAVWEDLGVQMNLNSTLVSYFHHLMLSITGNFGKDGAQYIPEPLIPLISPKYDDSRRTPITQSRVIGGLIPCNAVPDEILGNHPDRLRAVWIEASNPVHAYAGTEKMAEALRATDITVVLDIAMTETAMQADYVLPTPTQFEKAEFSFFNFDFPNNYSHLRQPVFKAPDTVLAEPEIHARLCEQLGVIPDDIVQSLREAATQGMDIYGQKLMEAFMANPGLIKLATVLLYRTLGPTLGEDLAAGAAFLPACLDLARRNPDGVRAAGHQGDGIELGVNLFKALISSPSGVSICKEPHKASFSRIGHGDGKIQLFLEELLPELDALRTGFQSPTSEEFPFVLSCGERRDYTANGMYRDAEWRRKDKQGALRISPNDAQLLDLNTGDIVVLKTQHGKSEATIEVYEGMQAGHMSIPNGGGLTNNMDSTNPERIGVATNELTSSAECDRIAGTPWHKHVPAAIERRAT